MDLLRRYTQLLRDARQAKDAADGPVRPVPFPGRFNCQRVLTAGTLEGRDHVTDTRALHIVEVEDLETIGRRHDVANGNLVVVKAALLRKLDRSFAQDIRGSDDPEQRA